MKLKHSILSGLMSLGVAITGMGCLITAFGFHTAFQWSPSFSWPALILALALWTTLTALLLSLRHGGKILLVLMALCLGYVFRRETVMLQVESLLFHISTRYNSAYHWGYITWSGSDLSMIAITWGLILGGCLISTAVCWVVLRRKPAIWAMIVGLLPLVVCCVVTDTVPATLWLLALVAALVLLLVTQGVRRRNTRQSIRLTALLLIPVLLFSCLMFWAVSPDQYATQSPPFHQAVTELLLKLPFVAQLPNGELVLSQGGVLSNRVDLTQIGSQQSYDLPVMDVLSTRTGMVYLRGQMMDTYDGLSWSNSSSHMPDPYWPVSGLQETATLQITTRAVHPIRYVPYYADGIQSVQNNTDNAKSYSYQIQELVSSQAISGAAGSYSHSPQQYLQLPEETRQWAISFLRNESNAISPSYLTLSPLLKNFRSLQANLIAQIVRTNATYDLNTPAMPEDSSDFVRWFLESSDTGYCTHFASAAVVLLRAAGVPARYVTGYTVNTLAHRRITITTRQAHAWVEYLDDDLCWKVLDPTPGGGNLNVDATEDTTAPPEETEPETTEPPETTLEPTEETTEPTEETTRPVIPTEGTAAAPTRETTAPTGEEEPGVQPRDLSWLWTLLKVLLWLTVAAAGIFGQYLLRLQLRRKQMHTGDPHRRAVTCWRYARLLGRLLRCNPPERLLALAEKAAFSQHTLTQAELNEFYAFHDAAHRALNTWNLPLRLTVKLIFAIG